MRRSDAIPIVVLTLSFIAICTIAIISQLDVSKYDADIISTDPSSAEFYKKVSVANIALLQTQVYWAALSAFLAGLGSLATAAGILFIAAQLRLTRQQLDRDRAYVHFNGLKWLSFSADRVKTDNWGIFPLWINSGVTPAIDVELWYGWSWFDYDEFPDFDAPRPPGHRTILRPGGQIEMTPVFLDPAEIVTPPENRNFCIWGEAKYKDIFSRDTVRVTRFCVKLVGYNGDPKLDWRVDSNPVNLHFANMGKNFGS